MGVVDRVAALWIEIKARNIHFTLEPFTVRKRGREDWYIRPPSLLMPAEDWRSFKWRTRITYIVALALLFVSIVYTVMLPLSYIFSSSKRAHIEYGFTKDAVGHFIGSEECGIFQSNIYASPLPSQEGSRVFCNTRDDLLKALSWGGGNGQEKSSSGIGCTYKWFTTPEICMILEGFNAVIFIGDTAVQDIYTALNMLLREDFSLGGLHQSKMGLIDRKTCSCENQFLTQHCKQNFSIKSYLEPIADADSPGGGSAPYCSRIPHMYIPIYSSPTTVDAFSAFKSLTYSKPNPWQPSPVIHSLTLNAAAKIDLASQSLREWQSYAEGAERNIPFLSLGPAAAAVDTVKPFNDKDNDEIWKLSEEMERVARESHVDFLGLYNLTVNAEGSNGSGHAMKAALVKAMMVVNWLAKLPTS